MCNKQIFVYDTPYQQSQLLKFSLSMVTELERVQFEKDGISRDGLRVKLTKGGDLKLVWGDVVIRQRGLWLDGLCGGNMALLVGEERI